MWTSDELDACLCEALLCGVMTIEFVFGIRNIVKEIWIDHPYSTLQFWIRNDLFMTWEMPI